jgi:mitochondrial Rho GTPase 1
MASGTSPQHTGELGVKRCTADTPVTVRICVCGDEGTGKSSLIATFVKGVFTPGKIQPVLPAVTLPPDVGNALSTTIVDTSARPQDRTTLRKEIRKANVLLLVYSDHYSYERVALFWMPYFRSLGVNLPVVVCANKSDQTAEGQSFSQVVEEEMKPVMAEFREIDTCIRTSAKQNFNVVEAILLCQNAVAYPLAPLFDYKEGKLKPACADALRRVFYLCDKDHDGILNDEEMKALEAKVIGKPSTDEEVGIIKRAINKALPEADLDGGINVEAFLQMNKLYAEGGNHGNIWRILRKHRYTDSLSLEDVLLHPKFEVPQHSSAELSPAGYKFFVDLFLLFDKNKDGVLHRDELQELFAPTPGLPKSWTEAAFPSSTVRNEAGHITLQGWLAQWSMTTFLEPKTTLEYLAYLGFEPSNPKESTTAALKITKPRKRRRRLDKVERTVVHAYVLGAPGVGKSALLDAFLKLPYSGLHRPTIQPRRAVDSVELTGGKQCYLILEELGVQESAVLENPARLDACDLICYAYDSSDPESFSHIVDLRTKHPQLDELPAVFTALKADMDKATQRAQVQPEAYTAHLNMSAPLHVSVKWSSISELFVALAEAATHPASAFPKAEEQPVDRTNWVIVGSGVVCVAVAAGMIWRRSTMAG